MPCLPAAVSHRTVSPPCEVPCSVSLPPLKCRQPPASVPCLSLVSLFPGRCAGRTVQPAAFSDSACGSGRFRVIRVSRGELAHFSSLLHPVESRRHATACVSACPSQGSPVVAVWGDWLRVELPQTVTGRLCGDERLHVGRALPWRVAAGSRGKTTVSCVRRRGKVFRRDYHFALLLSVHENSCCSASLPAVGSWSLQL